MKEITESDEVMEAYARIDLYYLVIQKNAINLCNFFTSTKEVKQISINAIKIIIESKKFIEADYSGDEKFLNALIDLNTDDIKF